MTKKTILFIVVAAFLGAAASSFLAGPGQTTTTDVWSGLRAWFPSFGSRTGALPFTGTRVTGATPETALQYEEAVTGAVDKTSPAVISIIITKNLPIIERCRGRNPFSDLPPEFQQFFGNDFDFSIPCDTGKTRQQEVGGGSGFIISSDGLIATNKHVVLDPAASYTVLTNDGRKFDARVLARDPVRDIAVIKISSSGLPTVRLGDSSRVKLGQTAIAIGNALGEFRNTVSVGVISGLARSITAQGEGLTERIEGLIQTDAAINPGNSGGPLLNLKGEVIGMNTAVVSGAQSIGFAIPVNHLKQAIESVRRTGRIIVPFLGVRYILLTPEIARLEDATDQSGALLKGESGNPAVVKNSPAETAGLLAGDIITEINGEKITLDNSLATIIQKFNVGDTVTLTIRRRGQTLKIQLQLEERP
ncbi:trypsin-like peptidase domain-containing protein [Candidatus Wolfebacteria bacterium]|nr:trypsin-like peptidase domain-containing protein [Candidatus Wolfebacteria bacterium]